MTMQARADYAPVGTVPRVVRVRRTVFRAARRKPLGAFGAIVLILLAVVGVFAPWIAPYDPNATSLEAQYAAPSWSHPFGTDNVGRDLFSQIVMGSRVSLAVGFGAVGLGLTLATILGLATYIGNRTDMVVQRVVDVAMGFPGLILLLAIMSVAGLGVIQVIVALGIWMAFAPSRVVRSSVLSIRETLYIEAARASGAGHLRIMFVHVLPNVVPVLLVIASLGVGQAILAEAAISYLGYGIPPPEPSWGRLVRSYIQQAQTAPWLTVIPGVVLTLTVFSFNVLGDALRDLLDPRLRM